MLYMPDLEGRAIEDRYELHALIGEGAFGRVYRGHDRRLERPVAIKVIKPWWAEDSHWVERFQREAKLLARVNDRGIIQIFDFGQAEEGPYYVAELVPGESLAERLARESLSSAEAVAIAAEICRALGSAHRQGVVHCDVKPANVMLTPEGSVKVGDFGVARLADGTSRAVAATVIGTPRYMSPEQARGRSTTPATDVYSTGVVLYEMLAGHPPFQSGSAVELGIRHIQDEPPPLPEEVPPGLRAIVARAMAKEPGDRYRDGAQMAAALLEAEDGAGAEAGAGADAGTSAKAATSAEARAGAGAGPPPGVRRRTPRPPAGQSPPPSVTIDLGAMRSADATRPLPGARTQKPPPPPPGGQAGHAPGGGRAATGWLRRGLAMLACLLVLAGILVVVLGRPGSRTTVPDLRGLSTAAARTRLSRDGLKYGLTYVAAPGSTAGEVLRQSPAPGTRVRRRSTVGLAVAEAPRWRPLTSFSGIDDGHSVPVQILGRQWRVNYEMSYSGTCLLLITCLGPSAEVLNLTTGSSSEGFELSEGSSESHTFRTGPGTYRLDVTGGDDRARWAMTIEDFY
jgi:serine/threonine-protein kinase